MVQVLIQPLDQPAIPSKAISARLRSQLVYFASPEPSEGAPALGENEYFLPAKDVARFLDDGFVSLVSPLDTANMTEVELSDEQEDFLNWLFHNKIQHIRVLE
jgi:hypothetical protein